MILKLAYCQYLDVIVKIYLMIGSSNLFFLQYFIVSESSTISFLFVFQFFYNFQKQLNIN